MQRNAFAPTPSNSPLRPPTVLAAEHRIPVAKRADCDPGWLSRLFGVDELAAAPGLRGAPLARRPPAGLVGLLDRGNDEFFA